MDLVAQLHAMEQIRQLKGRYFRFLDTKDWEGYGSVFTADAVFDLRAATAVDPDDGSPEAAIAVDFVLRGRTAIVKAVRASVRDNVTVHHGHCHEVTIEGAEQASGIIAMVDKITDRRTGALILEGYGHYHERYRREEGAWRIAHARLTRLRVTTNL